MAVAYPFDVTRLIDICRQNDVSMVGVFGSMARGGGSRGIVTYTQQITKTLHGLRASRSAQIWR